MSETDSGQTARGGNEREQPDTGNSGAPGFDLERLRNWLSGNTMVPALIAGAALLALIVALFMWASSPGYRVLFSNLADADGGRIVGELEQLNVPYQLSQGGQTIMVPGDQVHRLRLQLAEQGLPQGGNVGLELMTDQPFGISQFAEQVNFRRGLEGELASSIESLGPVQRARIHLAMARDSVFVRERDPAKASVVLNLHAGRTLSQGQVASITHLVASSVRDLNADHVTVVSQDGTLLSREQSENGVLDGSQLSYTHQLERIYQDRIEAILEPLFGDRNVRIQVAADVDFSEREETSERYGPNQEPGSAAVRSFQRATEYNGSDDVARGIPGALSNTPPGTATSPIALETSEEDADANEDDDTAETAQRGSLLHDDVVNYEVDRNILHTRHQSGQLQRLSVAVVVNYRDSIDEEGNPVREPITEDRLQQVQRLVRQSMGFSAERGDQLEVVNTPFSETFTEEPEVLEWWQQSENITLAVDLGRYLLILLLALLFYWLVVRPLMKRHTAAVAPAPEPALATAGGVEVSLSQQAKAQAQAAHEIEDADEELSFSKGGGSGAYGRNLKKMRELAQDDPHTVAMVVRKWMNDDR